MTTYTTNTPTDEALEVTLRLGQTDQRMRLSAWRTDRGTVGYSLTNGRGGTPYALSTLQHKGPTLFPTKAVAGWQAEVVAFATESLYTIEEVR